MPLVHSLSLSTHVNAHFWKVEKTETSLLEQLPLNAADDQLLAKKKKAADRYSFLAVRALLQSVGCTASVVYDAQGAPTLSNGQQLSISHTHHYVAVVLSDQLPVGIDVEAYRPKIARIAPSFYAHLRSFCQHPPPDDAIVDCQRSGVQSPTPTRDSFCRTHPHRTIYCQYCSSYRNGLA